MDNRLSTEVATASEMVAFARSRGVDLSSYYEDGYGLFLNRGRGICFWKNDCNFGYFLQGPITLLPNEFKDSGDAFHGMWNETGQIPDPERALEFFVAWIIDYKEVDELPDAGRKRGRWGIG